MSLLERVTTLIRADVTEIASRAENPERACSELLRDMHNQRIQLKTQVATVLASQHVLLEKHKGHEESAAVHMARAENAVQGKQEDVARLELNLALRQRELALSVQCKVEDHQRQAETLQAALQRLENKMAETRELTRSLTPEWRNPFTLVKSVRDVPRDADSAAADRTVEIDRILTELRERRERGA